MNAELVLDLLVALSLLVLAVLLLTSADFLRTAVLFIAFGLFMALAWVRLAAPDIALADAAIGAAITGVFLLDAIRHMEWEKHAWGGGAPGQSRRESRRTPVEQAGVGAAALVLLGLLAAGVPQLAEARPGLAPAVAAHMEELEHPVTAVLLVFRGLDTWLELGILLLGVIAILTARAEHNLGASLLAPPHDPVLEGVVRVLAPIAVLAAAYFLWLGTFAPGGAFQSGVVLGAVGMLLWLSGHASISTLPPWLWRLLAALGFACFTLSALITMLISGQMLAYPPSWTITFVESLELAAAVSIGACFAALFVGQHPGRELAPSAAGQEPDHAA